jgi:uncharacterized protein (TIGR02246 family)
MKRLAVALAIFGAIIALRLFTPPRASPPAEMTEAEIAQIETEVKQVLDDLMAAWNAEDLERSLAPFGSDDVHVVWATGVDTNPTMFRERMAEIWEWVLEWEGEWDYRHAKVISPTSALFLGRFHATLTYTSGDTRSWKPSLTCLLELGENGWKITTAHQVLGQSTLVEEG